MKTSENLQFPDVFKGHRNETLVENGLICHWLLWFSMVCQPFQKSIKYIIAMRLNKISATQVHSRTFGFNYSIKTSFVLLR